MAFGPDALPVHAPGALVKNCGSQKGSLHYTWE
jgi:hypothetical protein